MLALVYAKQIRIPKFQISNRIMFWKNRTAFVTGATGFVGAHIVRFLVEKDAKVVCLQRDSIRANALDVFDLKRKVTVIQGAVEDHALMARILNEYEIDAVFISRRRLSSARQIVRRFRLLNPTFAAHIVCSKPAARAKPSNE